MFLSKAAGAFGWRTPGAPSTFLEVARVGVRGQNSQAFGDLFRQILTWRVNRGHLTGAFSDPFCPSG
jgi:hypothetical protein